MLQCVAVHKTPLLFKSIKSNSCVAVCVGQINVSVEDAGRGVTVIVCSSVLQCAAVCCSLMQGVAVCCSVLQRAAECCNVLQSVAVCCSVLQFIAVHYSALQCVAVSDVQRFLLVCAVTCYHV